MPGPVGRTLHKLGVTSPDLLRRGAAIDRAGEHLLIDACTQIPAPSRQTAARNASAAGLARRASALGGSRSERQNNSRVSYSASHAKQNRDPEKTLETGVA